MSWRNRASRAVPPGWKRHRRQRILGRGPHPRSGSGRAPANRQQASTGTCCDRPPTRPRHPRPDRRGPAPPQPCGGDRAPRRRRLRLRRMDHADLRGHPRVLPHARGNLGRGDEGDVQLRGPRRRSHHAAPGGHRRHLPRSGDQRPDPVAAAEGVLCRPDVPLRAAAEGALPPVPPDRHRADRPRRTAGRCRGDRLRLGHPAGARRRR